MAGGVTLEGLKHNVAVGVLFIEAWLRGKGHYIFRGAVEDSATAEISRSQVWQWIRHRVGTLHSLIINLTHWATGVIVGHFWEEIENKHPIEWLKLMYSMCIFPGYS